MFLRTTARSGDPAPCEVAPGPCALAPGGGGSGDGEPSLQLRFEKCSRVAGQGCRLRPTPSARTANRIAHRGRGCHVTGGAGRQLAARAAGRGRRERGRGRRRASRRWAGPRCRWGAGSRATCGRWSGAAVPRARLAVAPPGGTPPAFKGVGARRASVCRLGPGRSRRSVAASHSSSLGPHPRTVFHSPVRSAVAAAPRASPGPHPVNRGRRGGGAGPGLCDLLQRMQRPTVLCKTELFCLVAYRVGLVADVYNNCRRLWGRHIGGWGGTCWLTLLLKTSTLAMKEEVSAFLVGCQ